MPQLMPDPYKGFGALRKGRHSSPGADYFLTICLQRPSSALHQADVGRQCMAELHRLQDEQAWTLRCGVIMPDHLHLLISLGQTCDLSSGVRLFKGRLTRCCASTKRLGSKASTIIACIPMRIACQSSSAFFSIPIARNSCRWISLGRDISAHLRTGAGLGG